mmetsp:Transcript_4797/g.11799  ORF Transcript_4797/g.11799 Transcript_4797/m.11799 type:complete len:1093 (+) Transcript_4797:168-3446(+)|eukprot:CAMPEP_0179004782 /NCGR_PEP_ID=MMETSP0795-20121207/13513_1 /TAXON_ID=88552 /ORGANISM="Amoebophrya sp., Strain Ameob2" /LENGTH=1092 /DNA_ID=CAMNT_0020699117 /DNA_START=134 /DNA_END=3412 /DNA_ORIENTATION=-
MAFSIGDFAPPGRRCPTKKTAFELYQDSVRGYLRDENIGGDGSLSASAFSYDAEGSYSREEGHQSVPGSRPAARASAAEAMQDRLFNMPQPVVAKWVPRSKGSQQRVHAPDGRRDHGSPPFSDPSLLKGTDDEELLPTANTATTSTTKGKHADHSAAFRSSVVAKKAELVGEILRGHEHENAVSTENYVTAKTSRTAGASYVALEERLARSFRASVTCGANSLSPLALGLADRLQARFGNDSSVYRIWTMHVLPSLIQSSDVVPGTEEALKSVDASLSCGGQSTDISDVLWRLGIVAQARESKLQRSLGWSRDGTLLEEEKNSSSATSWSSPSRSRRNTAVEHSDTELLPLILPPLPGTCLGSSLSNRSHEREGEELEVLLSEICQGYNEIVDAVACDTGFLHATLASAAKTDRFTARLLKIAARVYTGFPEDEPGSDDGADHDLSGFPAASSSSSSSSSATETGTRKKIKKDPVEEPRLHLLRQDFLRDAGAVKKEAERAVKKEASGRGSGGTTTSFKLVEINTIAVAFAGTAQDLHEMHTTLRNREQGRGSLMCHPRLTADEQSPRLLSADAYAKGLAAAHETFVKRRCRGQEQRVSLLPQELQAATSHNGAVVCFFVFEKDYLDNDQRRIQQSLRRNHGVRSVTKVMHSDCALEEVDFYVPSKGTVRRGEAVDVETQEDGTCFTVWTKAPAKTRETETDLQHDGGEESGRKFARSFAVECLREELLADGDLYVDGELVSVCYYHTGFSPKNHAGWWEIREAIERSSAIKVPTVLGQLAGTKKVQQAIGEHARRVFGQRGGVLHEKNLNELPPLQRVLRKLKVQYEKDPGHRHDRSASPAGGPSDCAEGNNESPTHRLPVKARNLLSTMVESHDLHELLLSQRGRDFLHQKVIPNADAWLLKPQREGGGNNLFGEDLWDKVYGLLAYHAEMARIPRVGRGRGDDRKEEEVELPPLPRSYNDRSSAPEAEVEPAQPSVGSNYVGGPDLGGATTCPVADGEYYVLMRKINALEEKNFAFFGGDRVLEHAAGIAEIGAFTVFFADPATSSTGRELNLSSTAFQRVKHANSNEGGICAGHGFLDIPPELFQNAL